MAPYTDTIPLARNGQKKSGEIGVMKRSSEIFVENARKSITEKFIRRDSTLDARFKDLVSIAAKGNFDALKDKLQAEEYPIAILSKMDEHGNTVLGTYAHKGCYDAVKYMVELVGVEEARQIVNNSGSNVLHEAAAHQKTDIVAYLLNMGFDPHQKNNHGVNPFYCSVVRGDIETCKVILANAGDDKHELLTNIACAGMNAMDFAAALANHSLENLLTSHLEELEKEHILGSPLSKR